MPANPADTAPVAAQPACLLSCRASKDGLASHKSIGHAIEAVEAVFPFENYMRAHEPAYRNVARSVLHLLPGGGKILDFGCGPCDKTAVLQQLGYSCTGWDDLLDDWHQIGANRAKIQQFAQSMGVRLHVAANDCPPPFSPGSFDMVMVHDVIEHVHDSPRPLLQQLIGLVRPGGFVFITVPNGGNIRKRLLLLLGGTNYPRFAAYFWSSPHWRGHVREYVKSDLTALARYSNLRILRLAGVHHRLTALPVILRLGYRLTVGLVPAWRDTWSLTCRKPDHWRPFELTSDELKRIRSRETAYVY